MPHVKGSHCETYLDVMLKFKSSFGEKFDAMTFYSASGESVMGAELSNAETGCEILDKHGLSWMCECRRFDEKLKIVSGENGVLPGTRYRVTLDDGRIIKGCIDEKGCTERIKSENSRRVEKIEFLIEGVEACCDGMSTESSESFFELKGVETSVENYGVSIKKVTVEKGYRYLSEGEKRLARLLFKDSIDYSVIKVFNKKYLPFQPQLMAIAPNGNIYFHPADFKEDFSIEARGARWFMHEMVHVWQHQLGYPVFWRGAARIKLDYDYTLAEGRRLDDYNMEAQGEVLADYFALKFLAAPQIMRKYEYSDRLWLYEDVLSEFIQNPGSEVNLP